MNSKEIELYHAPASAPCRLVRMTAAALKVPLNLNFVDLRAKEQFSPDYLKLNPQHTVPVMIDNGFKLIESRAIARYLINKYGRNASFDLYPENPEVRALIDQRLDFDLGTLYARFSQYFYPQIFAGAPPNKRVLKMLHESLSWLNIELTGHKFAVGNHLTLADLSLVASVDTIEAANISLNGYDNIIRWYEIAKKTIPAYDEISEGLDILRAGAALLQAKL